MLCITEMGSFSFFFPTLSILKFKLKCWLMCIKWRNNLETDRGLHAAALMGFVPRYHVQILVPVIWTKLNMQIRQQGAVSNTANSAASFITVFCFCLWSETEMWPQTEPKNVHKFCSSVSQYTDFYWHIKAYSAYIHLWEYLQNRAHGCYTCIKICITSI